MRKKVKEIFVISGIENVKKKKKEKEGRKFLLFRGWGLQAMRTFLGMAIYYTFFASYI